MKPATDLVMANLFEAAYQKQQALLSATYQWQMSLAAVSSGLQAQKPVLDQGNTMTADDSTLTQGMTDSGTDTSTGLATGTQSVEDLKTNLGSLVETPTSGLADYMGDPSQVTDLLAVQILAQAKQAEFLTASCEESGGTVVTDPATSWLACSCPGTQGLLPLSPDGDLGNLPNQLCVSDTQKSGAPLGLANTTAPLVGGIVMAVFGAAILFVVIPNITERYGKYRKDLDTKLRTELQREWATTNTVDGMKIRGMKLHLANGEIAGSVFVGSEKVEFMVNERSGFSVTNNESLSEGVVKKVEIRVGQRMGLDVLASKWEVYKNQKVYNRSKKGKYVKSSAGGEIVGAGIGIALLGAGIVVAVLGSQGQFLADTNPMPGNIIQAVQAQQGVLQASDDFRGALSALARGLAAP